MKMALTIESIASNVMQVGIIIVIAIVIIVVGFAIYFYFKNTNRYKEYICLIFFKDAFGNSILEKDLAGIFVDKATDLKRFFLKKHKVGLDPDKVKYIVLGKLKYVFLVKYSLKNFAFVDIHSIFNKDNPTLRVTEQDVNWAIHEYRKHKALDQKSLWKEYAPMLLWAFTLVCGLILAAWLFKKFDVLTSVASSLQAAAEALREAARTLEAVKTGTTILQ